MRTVSSVGALSVLGLLSPAVYADDSGAPAPAAPTSSAAVDATGDGCNPGSENEGFFQRLADSYKAHLFPTDAPAPAPTDAPAVLSGYDPSRVSEPSESVPPWPYSTWPEGGTAVIGYENMYYGPLMDAIWCGKHGKQLKDSRWTIYGW